MCVTISILMANRTSHCSLRSFAHIVVWCRGLNGPPGSVDTRGGNNISGTVPASLSALTNLNTLYLSWAKLDGTVPASFSALKRLEYLCATSRRCGALREHERVWYPQGSFAEQAQRRNPFGLLGDDGTGCLVRALTAAAVDRTHDTSGAPQGAQRERARRRASRGIFGAEGP